jgi:hypothetical protein
MFRKEDRLKKYSDLINKGKKMRTWQCTICNYIHKGPAPPDKCPVCGAGANKFIEITKEKDGQETGIEQNKTGMDKIRDMLVKHHAHPILVHTPNGLVPVAVLLWAAAWISGSQIPAKAAAIDLGFVVASLPLVIFTGVLEWKHKYKGQMTSAFRLKILAAAVTAVASTASLIWYLVVPDVLSSPGAGIFIFINIVMLGATGMAGHIGGKFVFRD